MAASTTNGHIEVTPGTCGGKPRIAGHRIRVQDIVMDHEAGGLSPDEICDAYPGITLADVYAALSYYHDHREEIRAHLDQEAAFVEQFKRDNPSRLAPHLNPQDADGA